MSTFLLISFLSMLSFSANAEEYFEEVDSGIALKYSEFKGQNSIAVEDIDVNSDGKLDLVFHFWSSLNGLSSELLDSPPPDFLKIYVQSETGVFEDKTQEILGESKPSLRGASRHLVKGDFNNDGKEDLAYAINYEDARLVDDPADLSAQLAALLSTASGYEIKFFGTPSWYHSLGVGADQEGRSFVTGNGFSGNFQAELWRFDESNNALAVNADGLEIPPNAFEFLTQSTEAGTDLLLRNANYPDMFGIYAYQRVAESWTLVDQINNPYEGLGSVSILGWNSTGYGDASVVDINGYASLEGGGSSYAESCSIRLRPDDKPVALFKVSSAYVPTFGEVDSITSEDTIIFNSLVGFGFENNKITKNILRIENEDPFINANFFDCADVDGDGYDDIAMYPYGQNPLVYINDQKGKFYKLDAARIPSVKDPTNWYYGKYGPLSSLLRDLTGDGIPDLLFWPANGIPDNNFGNELGEYLDIKMFKGINRLTKNSVDSDGDSISDENEERLGLDPLLADSDGDGTSDPLDAFPLDDEETDDTDGDGIGNNLDLDDDGDGVEDLDDAFSLISLGGRIDTDGDGRPNECDAACIGLEMAADIDDDNDSVLDINDDFPLDRDESRDTDSDAIGDNSDAFPQDASESVDTDGDGLGNNADPDDDNDGFTDEEELADGTDPLSRFSCRTGCFSFDVDENLEAQPLTDGLLVIRHLFGFSGDSLISGAVSGDASRNGSDAIASYLTDADTQLDIDGDGESKPLTDGLLLIRYLFGFSGDSLISGAIGSEATRDTAEAVEAYIKERVPAD